MATRKELESKKNIARTLYMNGEQQKYIAEQIGISKVTLSKWVTEGKWETERAARSITRPELVNKMLKAINDILDNAVVNGMDTQTVDQLSKFSKVIENLDRRTNIVNVIETFTAFGEWLKYRIQFNLDIDAEFVDKVLKYQNLYIEELMTKQINGIGK